jgi:hypothetical protein
MHVSTHLTLRTREALCLVKEGLIFQIILLFTDEVFGVLVSYEDFP